ncbi:MAG: hypothetical protein E6K05_07115 [Methanobacteriota archaeon]|nr:MAG: hypothetical protein E6K05_07115 [Euryarchaeota archaeon]
MPSSREVRGRRGWFSSCGTTGRMVVPCPPPVVEAWNGHGSHPGFDGTPFRHGSRAGCIVLSPCAKSGCVSNALHSHVSSIKFCETNFGLSALGAPTSPPSTMCRIAMIPGGLRRRLPP